MKVVFDAKSLAAQVLAERTKKPVKSVSSVPKKPFSLLWLNPPYDWSAKNDEVQVEASMNRGMTDPDPETETLLDEADEMLAQDIKKASTEVEKIGERIVRVQFGEYVGKRKRRVTHIEVREAEIEEMVARSDKAGYAQFTLF